MLKAVGVGDSLKPEVLVAGDGDSDADCLFAVPDPDAIAHGLLTASIYGAYCDVKEILPSLS